MSFLRFIIFLLGVFIIIFLLALLLPSKVTVAKSVDINASHDKIKNQIANFEQWKNWYPAFKDENITIVKNPSKENIISSVTLKDKEGKTILLNLVDTSNNKINIDVESASSTKVDYTFLLIPKLNNQTQLTWDVNINLGWYPWKRIEGILFDKFSGSQYEAALDDLRKAAEN
ncbi:MAG: SRPBCC family protein [Bacteroidota bacterium]|nr:SRPBCC family protein [Bacteroidota bacterium]